MRKLFYILLFATLQVYAQQSAIDSMLTVVKEQNTQEQVSTYAELSWHFHNSNIDSALFYGRKVVKLSRKAGFEKGVASGFNSLATAYEASGALDSAIAYHEKSLEIKRKIKDDLGTADTYNNLGIIADKAGDFDVALEYYFDALKIYEEEPDAGWDKVPMVYSNIGIVYKKQKEYERTLDYYEKALAIYEQNNHEIGATITRGNIGSLLLRLEQYDQAIKYATEASDSYQKLGYSRYIPYMLVNRAVAQDSLGQHEKANSDFKKAINQFEADENPYELAHALIGYGRNLLYLNEPLGAKIAIQRALDLSIDNDFKEFEVNACRFLAMAHAKAGDYQSAYLFQDKYRIANDSLFEREKTKSIFELDTKYQTEKKDRQLAEQRNEILKKELEVNQRNNMLILLGLVLLAALVLGYLLYRQQKLKNRQLKQEAELREAQAQLETQERLQQQRLRISRDLHDNIGSQLTFLISSLDNLKYAQNVSKEFANEKLDNLSTFTRSTITELRDTIWAMNKNDISIQDLKDRLVIHQRNAQNAGKNFTVELADHVNVNEQFNSVRGMHYFRIVQEAINNAMKYADTDEVSVRFEKQGNQLVTYVKDHGRGFDPEQQETGNGLRNMKERAQLMEGSVEVHSEPEKGTEITISAPVN